MVLYKATSEGQVQMTAQEESEIKAQWAQYEKEVLQPKPKTLEERVAALEAIVFDKGAK